MHVGILTRTLAVVNRRSLLYPVPVPSLPTRLISTVRLVKRTNAVCSRRKVVATVGVTSVVRSVLRLILHVLLALSNGMLHHVVRHALLQTPFLTFASIDLCDEASGTGLWLLSLR